jgi:hypothetical protein
MLRSVVFVRSVVMVRSVVFDVQLLGPCGQERDIGVEVS